MSGPSEKGGVRPAFDELIHAPTRLRLAAALSTGTWVEFSALETGLELSASLLSKNLKLLTDAGYAELERRPQTFGRPRTWVRLTPSGRRAYLGHVAALRELLTTDPDA